MKDLKVSKNDLIELQNQLLNPGFSDKSGRTELNKRADENRKCAQDSEKKKIELELVFGLLDNIVEFKSQDISLLISYIRQSGFSETALF